MTNPRKSQPTLGYWLISGTGLIWNLLGAWIFFSSVTMTDEQRAASFTDEAQIRFLESIPMWATLANALAVVLGIAGCVLLLMRRKMAVPAFIGSFIALLVQDLHSFVLNDAVALFGMFPVYIQGTVFVIAILLLLYARGAARRGVLR